MPYYKTIITLEVLSDVEVDASDLEGLSSVLYSCIQGDMSDGMVSSKSEELTEEQMIAACEAQRSESRFTLSFLDDEKSLEDARDILDEQRKARGDDGD